jgi:hypothetical protein
MYGPPKENPTKKEQKPEKKKKTFFIVFPCLPVRYSKMGSRSSDASVHLSQKIEGIHIQVWKVYFSSHS